MGCGSPRERRDRPCGSGMNPKSRARTQKKVTVKSIDPRLTLKCFGWRARLGTADQNPFSQILTRTDEEFRGFWRPQIESMDVKDLLRPPSPTFSQRGTAYKNSKVSTGLHSFLFVNSIWTVTQMVKRVECASHRLRGSWECGRSGVLRW